MAKHNTTDDFQDPKDIANSMLDNLTLLEDGKDKIMWATYEEIDPLLNTGTWFIFNESKQAFHQKFIAEKYTKKREDMFLSTRYFERRRR